MTFLNIFISVCVFITVTLIVLIFVFPNEAGRRKRKMKKAGDPEEAGRKDWEEAAIKLEKHVYTLRQEVERLNQECQKNLRELALEKAKNTKLQEKILQEKQWIDKEQGAVDKITKENSGLRKNLVKAEQEKEKEYFLKLKLEQELKEIKQAFEDLNGLKKELSSKLLKTEANMNYYKEEFAKQKKISDDLLKQNEEISWVSKTEYEKIEKLLREKEKELERIQREYTQ